VESKREIAVFLALLAALSGAVYTAALQSPGGAEDWGRYMLPFMWTPGLAAILTQLALHRSPFGLGWRLGSLRYYLITYFGAAALLLGVFLFVWAADLGGYDPSFYREAAAQYGLPPGVIGSLGLLAITAVSAVVSVTSTLGEELGWRGFLVPRLRSVTSFARTSLVVGLLWAAWHYPGIWAWLHLRAPEVPVWFATISFTWLTVSLSFVHSWLRLKSGSVWPSALFHAAGNSFGYALAGATQDIGITRFVTPEYGVALPLATSVFAYLCWKHQPAHPDAE